MKCTTSPRELQITGRGCLGAQEATRKLGGGGREMQITLDFVACLGNSAHTNAIFVNDAIIISGNDEGICWVKALSPPTPTLNIIDETDEVFDETEVNRVVENENPHDLT